MQTPTTATNWINKHNMWAHNHTSIRVCRVLAYKSTAILKKKPHILLRFMNESRSEDILK